MEQLKPRVDPSGQKIIDFIQRIYDEVGPRLAGSEEEKKAGNIIQEELRQFCDEVYQEEFICRPRGFLDFIWITTIFYLAGVVAYFFIHPLLSSFLIFIALAIYFVQSNLLFEVIDFIFPKKTEFHILGKIKPQNEPKKLVLLSGHHDSAYEFPLLSKLGRKSVLLILTAVMCAILNIFLSLSKIIVLNFQSQEISQIDPFNFLRTQQEFTIPNSIDVLQLFIFSIGTVVILILARYLRSNKVVFGANDNLSAIGILLECSEYLSRNRPETTEIWLISFAGEEHMRGSKRFVSLHHKELLERKALLLNLECLSAEVFLVATAEYMFLTKHSSLVVDKVIKAAHKVKVPIKVGPLPFAGSDAANFSRKGLHAATLFGLSKTGVPDYWHTLNDTPEKLSGPNIAKAVEIALQFVYDIDLSD
ncbi:MAG: M28 family metallopeptidase [Candidatus Hermodarchaeota archaeon]